MTHRPRPRALSAAVTLTAALALLGCTTDESLQNRSTSGDELTPADQDAYPVTVTNCGRQQEYDKAPERVLLGYPRTLETLQALGVEDAAFGYALGSYAPLPDDYPAAVTEVSPDYTPTRESVIAAAPDLFLSNDEGQIVSEGGIGLGGLERSGAAAYVLGGYCDDEPAPTSLDVVLDDVATLGQIFGVADEAARTVSDLEGRIAEARQAAGDEQLSIAFVQVFDGTLYAISGYPASGLIEALGQTNEWEDVDENFAEISTEEALIRTPDVLAVVHVGPETADAARTEVEDLLAGTPAVEAGRVMTVDETDFQAGGVSIIDALEKLTAEVFPASIS